MMKTILVSWLGDHDFASLPSTGEDSHVKGPVEQAVCSYSAHFQRPEFDEVILLCNWGSFHFRSQVILDEENQKKKTSAYCEALHDLTAVPISYRLKQMENVTDYTEVYNVVTSELETIVQKRQGEKIQFVFHISSGTPTMQAIWLLLSKTEYPGTILIKTSIEKGLELVDFPFDIAVKNEPFYGDDVKFQNLRPESLAKIKWQSSEMQEVLALSGNIARHDDMRVLIQGETGTGKELFAELIHQNSSRATQPFITLNCGAIPENLIESELFGHKRGAFTGAERDKKGCFELADGGTLFLDEIGELPLMQQVKILRLTDRHQQRFNPVGSETELKVDVRIIAATHRNLMADVADGKFREDLFYRLCDAFLKLPSLRERTGDIERLADHFVAKINERINDSDAGFKSLSFEARLFLKSQPWPGNVRELEATISRAYKLYSRSSVIGREDIEKSMIAPITKVREDGLMSQPFGEGFSIREIELKTRTHYAIRAIKESGEMNVAHVAKMLGLKSGTFAKQLRENTEFQKCLEGYQEGRRLLSRLK